MQFSPGQIENRDFAPQLKGYDEGEVRDFLRMLDADYRELVEGGRPHLTAEEIESRRFSTGVRGLDVDDVHAFLGSVAREYRSVRPSTEAAAPAMPAPVVEPTSPPQPTAGDAFDQLGAEIADVLRHATETAARLQREGEAEAALLRQRTMQEAQALRAQAEREAADLVRAAEARLAELQEVEGDLARRFAEAEDVVRRTIGSLRGESQPS